MFNSSFFYTFAVKKCIIFKKRMKVKRNFSAGWMLLFSGVIVATVACSKDVYDEQKYEELVVLMQPVDTIDANHDWQLTAEHAITVDASKVNIGTESLQILSANPAAGQGTKILGQYDFVDGEKRDITFNAPSTDTVFYAALVDANKSYTIARFTPREHTVDFSTLIATKAVVSQRLLTPQAYSYCFEGEVPQPGDYDYNDVVLHISQERTAKNQITLNVTLAAVGTEYKIGAAIQLIGYRYSDIDSIVTTNGKTFDDGYEKQYPIMIEDNDLLLRGINDEAIVNVFEDAHWATGNARKNEYGILDRRYYNVSKSSSTDFGIIATRTISYVITFKDATRLDDFTLNSIDPFIITEYNGSFWETHTHAEHRADQSLHEYSLNVSAKILPWSLVVPAVDFRYPLQGVNMGFYKKDVLFGAYMTRGHSFGEWASNRHISQDWYKYPTGNQVF